MLGVPIGEAEAAVRLGAADLFRLGCAVNAVTGTAQADPRGAHRIIGTGWNVQLATNFFRFGGFAENFGTEKIGWVESRFFDDELSDRALLLVGRDAAGEMRDEIGAFPKDIDRFAVKMNAGESGAGGPRRIDARNFD